MATYSAIATSEWEPEKPILSVWGGKVSENPTAIAEGATGAPKIQTAAIDDLAVTTVKIANNNVTTAKIATNEQMTSSNVLNATAGAAAGGVGTYAFLADVTNSGTDLTTGSTIAGSSLRYTSVWYDTAIVEWAATATSGAAPSGTWRLMGYGERTSGSTTLRYASLFLRIA